MIFKWVFKLLNDLVLRSLSGLRVLSQHISVQSYWLSLVNALDRLTSQAEHIANWRTDIRFELKIMIGS